MLTSSLDLIRRRGSIPLSTALLNRMTPAGRTNGLMRIVLASLVLGAGFAQSAPPPMKDDVYARGPISAVGHGALFDHAGKEIRMAPKQVLEAQRYYLERLQQFADSTQKARYEAFKRRLQGDQPLTSHEQVFVDASLTSWLIDQVKPAHASQLASISSALRQEYAKQTNETFTPSAQMLEAMKAERPGSAAAFSTGTSGAAYVEACRLKGVPIPPDWGGGQWMARGVLQTKFISQSQVAEVFTFESSSPRGICFALPRSTGNSINLLGIICQGNDTGNACFWDNQVNDVNVAIPRGTFKPLSQFAGGAELFGGGGGVCTSCHVGENAFVIHPGTPLDLGSSVLMPARWHRPLVHPQWPANPGPENFLAQVALPNGAGSCLSCHTRDFGGRLPQVSTELSMYCSTILGQAMTRTMPPGSPGDAAYAAHRNALTAACARPASQGPLDPVGGNTIAIWRPSTGTWWVVNHVTGASKVQQWGLQHDIPVAADYDGDGTTDFAVWRPSTGTWFVIESSTGISWNRQWGVAGDVPVPANYRTAPSDGVELTVWRPSTGTWFVLNRRTGASESRQWGGAGDVPVPGRYETVSVLGLRFPVPSFTVWRPSNGTWFVQNVGNSATASRAWGGVGDVPVPADYNNDLRTDLAIWRPSTGVWFILNSSLVGATSGPNMRTQQWGLPGDIPVPRDYDRDGIVDLAVWRPSEGNWYIIRSTDGSGVVHHWGEPGDIPVPYTVASPL
ncbi:MAG TPA: VCBS repeat-containing protein [Steroidobacteraceae bacterium]|nr:VCBS repeat-containing protein [Steroidobacteraceae bacterium]